MVRVASAVTCATMLKVLADDTRLHVVRILMTGPSHVNNINKEIPIDQSLLSHHLKILRDSGIVTATRDGKAVLYRLSPSVESRRKGKGINLGCCVISFE